MKKGQIKSHKKRGMVLPIPTAKRKELIYARCLGIIHT